MSQKRERFMNFLLKALAFGLKATVSLFMAVANFGFNAFIEFVQTMLGMRKPKRKPKGF